MYDRLKGKKNKNKSIETAPEKDLMPDILDKDFKTTVLQLLQKLKEDVVSQESNV